MVRSLKILFVFAMLLLTVGCVSTKNGSQESMSKIPVNQLSNPLWEEDFPDPHILRVKDGWVAYATGNPGYTNIGVSFSRDFLSWTDVEEALPERPSWQPIRQGLTWAPDVSFVDGKYLMLYVARDDKSGLQCLSRAWSEHPTGPFVDNSTKPFFCQMDQGGTIDPHLFVNSDGKRFLFFKNDGNAIGVPTIIWAANVDIDADPQEEPQDTGLRNFRSWHGSVVEAPAVFQVGKKYFLTYSGNDYNSEYYAIGWASSDSPMGPWTDHSIDPLLATTGVVAGPGGQQIFKDDNDKYWIAYHAWTQGHVGYGNGAGNARSFRVDPINVVNNIITTNGPSAGPIDKPVTR